MDPLLDTTRPTRSHVTAEQPRHGARGRACKATATSPPTDSSFALGPHCVAPSARASVANNAALRKPPGVQPPSSQPLQAECGKRLCGRRSKPKGTANHSRGNSRVDEISSTWQARLLGKRKYSIRVVSTTYSRLAFALWTGLFYLVARDVKDRRTEPSFANSATWRRNPLLGLQDASGALSYPLAPLAC